MLSCILNSERAIEVNIRVIRIFTRMRELLISQKDVLFKIEQMENQMDGHSADIQIIFDALKELISQPNPPRNKIGF